ncbi:MAG: class I tRNA ligase family protein [Hymenobacter sp.]
MPGSAAPSKANKPSARQLQFPPGRLIPTMALLRESYASKTKFYITTSIAYVNGLPHIGYAAELTQADVLARWHRMLGEDVFLTGTRMKTA